MKLRPSSGKPKRPRFIVRQVTGDSMLPTLRPGRIVMGVGKFRKLRVGDVVIASHDGLEKIKRITVIRAGHIFLCGDNQEHSTDSRSFGWLHMSVVRAKVIWPRNLHRRVEK